MKKFEIRDIKEPGKFTVFFSDKLITSNNEEVMYTDIDKIETTYDKSNNLNVFIIHNKYAFKKLYVYYNEDDSNIVTDAIDYVYEFQHPSDSSEDALQQSISSKDSIRRDISSSLIQETKTSNSVDGTLTFIHILSIVFAILGFISTIIYAVSINSGKYAIQIMIGGIFLTLWALIIPLGIAGIIKVLIQIRDKK